MARRVVASPYRVWLHCLVELRAGRRRDIKVRSANEQHPSSGELLQPAPAADDFLSRPNGMHLLSQDKDECNVHLRLAEARTQAITDLWRDTAKPKGHDHRQR